MKRILTYIIFLTLSISTLSNEYQDYTLFSRGKNAYYSENYEEAKQSFEILMRTFPKSTIFEKNYAYFYIGMSYFNLKDFKKAIYYLEKATYAPDDNELNNNPEIEKTIYFSQKDFALGYSLLKTNNIEKALIYLKRVDYTVYFPLSAYFEHRALELLSNYDDKAYSKLKLKFYYDFNEIPKLSLKELTDIGEFYISEKSYGKAKEFYNILLTDYNLKEDELTIYESYLKLLVLDKDYDTLIKFTENTVGKRRELAMFYRGVTFYKKREFSRAVYLFEEIKSGIFYEKARYYLASIYYSLGNYKDTIAILKYSKADDLFTKNMLAASYLALGEDENFRKTAEDIVKKYANTYLGIYYSLMLEDKDTTLTRITTIKDLSLLMGNILSHSKNLPSDFLKKANSLEMQQLTDIAKFGDEDILKLVFKKRNLLEKNTLSYNYSTTVILEKGDFYSLALKNSQQHMREFLKYKELIQYIYPRYFKEDIHNYAKKYDVPEELIYTIIYNVSGFNSFYTSEDSKFGLMGIAYDRSKPYKMRDLFNASYNIELGVQKLKKLLETQNGNKIKALIAYIYGEDYLNTIYFINNNINFSSVTTPENRYFLENLLITYIFYNKLYEY